MVLAAVTAGLVAPTNDRRLMLLPVAFALGVAVLAVAVTRFEWFVGFVLLIRSSLDMASFGSTVADAAGAISVVFIGASCVWLLARREESVTVSPTAPLIPPIAAFFAAALASVGFSAHPLDSLVEVVRFGTLLVVVAVLGRLIRDDRTVRLFLGVAIASTIVPLLVAARQIASGGVFVTAEGLDRVRGTFLHSNPFAAYLFLMITLIVSILPHVPRRWWLVLVPLCLGCGGALISTYARGAWAATIVAIVVIGILQDRRLLWLLGATLVVVVLAVPSVAVRLADLTESQKASGAPGNSLVWRLEYWEEVLRLQDNPVFGIGFKEVEQRETAAKAPHNDPIRVYVETGLVGLAAYLWLLVTLAREARRTLRRAPPGLPRGLAVAFAASFAGLVLLSLAANVITQLVILWYFVTIVALAMARARLPSPAAA